MINADGDVGLRGKGAAAEKRYVSQAVLFGRDENIGATVTVSTVVSYSDRTRCVFMLTAARRGLFLLKINLYKLKGEKYGRYFMGVFARSYRHSLGASHKAGVRFALPRYIRGRDDVRRRRSA